MKKTVRELIEMIDNNQLHYDVTTQRQFIYNNITQKVDNGEITKAGNVIRSILSKKIQLPALFFWKNSENDYNIHDGKQRILSIYYFVKQNNNEHIAVSTILKEIGSKTWNTLSEDMQNELLNYSFDIVVHEGGRELETRSFDLINTNSVPLTPYECIRGLHYGKWINQFEEWLKQFALVHDKFSREIGRGEEAILYLYLYFGVLDWTDSNS